MIYFIYLILYKKNMIKNNFLFKKEEVTFYIIIALRINFFNYKSYKCMKIFLFIYVLYK